MKYCKILIFCLSFIAFDSFAQTVWHNPVNASEEPYIEGRAWNKEIGKSYNRMPERLKDKMPSNVWRLSHDAAGLKVRFSTNADTIYVRYKTMAGAGGLINLTPLSCSGADLYVFDNFHTPHWMGNHMQWNFRGDSVDFAYTGITLPSSQNEPLEYTLYLPSYNGVKKLEIGVNSSDSFRFIQPSKVRPVVIYGSSIVQGASPSRPGLMFTNIVERSLAIPVVNLGFSGAAFMEPEVFRAMSEIDAEAFVIDPIPNSYRLPGDSVFSRAVAGVHLLRAASDAPILLVESCPQPDSLYRRPIYDTYIAADLQLRKAYDYLIAEGVKRLYFLPHSNIKMTENSMIEGTHPNDIGCMIYADAYVRSLRKMLPGLGSKR